MLETNFMGIHLLWLLNVMSHNVKGFADFHKTGLILGDSGSLSKILGAFKSF